MNDKEYTEPEFDERLVFQDHEEYNLSEDAVLDKYELEIHAEHQAHIYQKWSELLVQAQAKAARLKEVVSNVEADLFIKGKTGGMIVDGKTVDKPSDPTVKAWVQTQKRYKRITAKRRKAENNVAYLQNALKVLEHKRSMIKIESDLWITGYYARPYVSQGLKENLDEGSKKRHSEQLKESMQKRHLRQEED
jgi:hypothetical protein